MVASTGRDIGGGRRSDGQGQPGSGKRHLGLKYTTWICLQNVLSSLPLQSPVASGPGRNDAAEAAMEPYPPSKHFYLQKMYLEDYFFEALGVAATGESIVRRVEERSPIETTMRRMSVPCQQHEIQFKLICKNVDTTERLRWVSGFQRFFKEFLGKPVEYAATFPFDFDNQESIGCGDLRAGVFPFRWTWQPRRSDKSKWFNADSGLAARVR